MRTIILTVLIACFSCRLNAQTNSVPTTNAPPKGTTAYRDWRNGFRDTKFGIHRADLGETKYQTTKGQYIVYSRNETNETLGTIHINLTRYWFLRAAYADHILS